MIRQDTSPMDPALNAFGAVILVVIVIVVSVFWVITALAMFTWLTIQNGFAHTVKECLENTKPACMR